MRRTAAPVTLLHEFCFSRTPGPILLKTDALALEVSLIFFATPQARECHFWTRTRRTAATASVFGAQKQGFSLQSGPFWAKSELPALGVLKKNYVCDTSSTRGSLLSWNDCSCSVGPFLRRAKMAAGRSQDTPRDNFIYIF